jgi:phage baseplate assembly protein gpV
MEFSENRDDKEVTLRVNKDWKINVLTESGGIIDIGSSGVGDSVDVNVKAGNTGTVTVKAASTEVKVETSKVSVKSTDIDLIGDVKVDGKLEVTKAVTLKDKLDVKGDISGEKEVTAMAKGAKVTLTKHMHPTAVPGPAAPATPGT